MSYTGCGCHPWPALPALRCPQRSSRRSASCGCWRCAPGQFHAMPVVQSVLGGVRCEAHQQADFRRAVGRQMSPYDLPIGGIRPQNALHQGEEVGHDIAHGAALAACLQLVEYFLAMLRRQPPQGGLHVLCWSAWALLRQGGKLTDCDAESPLPSRARYVRSFIHIRLIRTALLSRHAASVSGLLRNKRAASGITRQWQWVGCLVRLRRRRRGKSSSS